MILIREEAHYSRTYVFDASDKPRQAHPDYWEIQPEHVKVTLYREGEREPWQVQHVTMAGPRILSDGSVGVRRTHHEYSTIAPDRVVDPCAPDWLADAVTDALGMAERDRTGATA